MEYEEAAKIRRRLRFMTRSLVSLEESIREHLSKIERHSKSLRGLLEDHDREFAEMCADIDFPAWVATLSVRARTVLKRSGIIDSSTLSRLTEDRLLGAPNCGRTTFNEIRDTLAARGVVIPAIPSGEDPA